MSSANTFKLVLAFFLSVFAASAQVNLSAIGGVVTDAQGKRIPGASVIITAPATGLVRQTQTGSNGVYFAADLPVGVYTVEISQRGFSNVRFDHVLQEVGKTRTLDAQLAIAPNRAETNVIEALVQLDRSNATVGSPVAKEEVFSNFVFADGI